MKKIWAQFISLNLADMATATAAIIGTITIIISILFKRPELTTQSLIQSAINFLADHLILIWLVTSSLFILFLILQYIRIRRQLNLVFIDDFTKPLEQNWDFAGPWKINHDCEMLVTGSDQGGLTKKGVFWENYVFTFEVKILRGCIGVIVRALDSQNYYMFQITIDSIRPHRRISIPTLEPSHTDEGKFDVSENRVGWLIMHDISLTHRKLLDKWFKVKMYVKGKSIEIYLDNEKIFYKENFFENAYGKVGFRNVTNEEALIRKTKVEII